MAMPASPGRLRANTTGHGLTGPSSERSAICRVRQQGKISTPGDTSNSFANKPALASCGDAEYPPKRKTVLISTASASLRHGGAQRRCKNLATCQYLYATRDLSPAQIQVARHF